MVVLSDTYIFYADVYFIQNFIIKIAVIYLALYINKFHSRVSSLKGIAKIIAVSFAGTVIEILGIFLSGSYNAFVLLVNIFEIPIMIWVILGKQNKQIFRVIVTGYFFIMLISSVVEAMWNWFGDTASYILLLICACGATIVAVHVWKNYSKMQKGVFPIALLHGEIRVSTHGFYDSGNKLKDPYTGKGVHIVSEKLIIQLELEKQQPVFVPYQALGNEGGIIEVYYVDELIIEGEKQSIHLQKSPLGVTKDNLFEGKNYEIILNEEVF